MRLRWAGALLAPAILLPGCAMVSGKRQPDGTLTVTSWRLFWKSERIEFATSGTNWSVSLRVGSSITDAQSVKAVAEGAAQGAVKGVKGF